MSVRSKLRFAGIIVGALILLAVVLVFILQSGPVRRSVLQHAEEYLRTSQGINLQADDLHYSLLSGSVTLRGLVLRSTTAPDLPAFLTADRVYVQIGLLSLARGLFHLENARLEGVSAHVVLLPGGRDNLPPGPETMAEKQSGGLPKFLISHLLATRTSLVLQDRAQQLRVEIPESRFEMRGSKPDLNHTIDFSIQHPASVTFEGRQAPIGALAFQAGLPGDLGSVALDNLRAQLAGSELRASGRVNDLSDPKLDFDVQAEVDLADTRRLAGLDQPVSGRLSVKANLKGGLSTLEVLANLQGENLAVRQFKQLGLQSRLRWSEQANRVQLESFQLDSPQGSASGTGLLALDTAAGPSQADLTFRSLDLLGLTRLLDTGVMLASRASGSLQASWPGLQFEQATGNLGVRLDATRSRASKNVLPVAGQINAEAAPSRVRVSDSSIQIPGLRADLDAVVNDFDWNALGRGRGKAPPKTNDLSGELSARVTDLSTLAHNLSALGGSTSTSPPAAGQATLQATLHGTLENPAAAVRLQAPNLQLGQLKNISIQGSADATTRQIQIQNLVAEWQQQAITASGRVGLEGNSPSLDLQLQARQTTLQSLLAALGKSDIPATGTANLRAQVGGTVANPEARLDLAVTELEAYTEPFGQLSAVATVQGQLLRVDTLRLEKPAVGRAGAGTLTASGSYNLESHAYEVHVTSQGLQLAHLALPGNETLAGQLAISAEGSGSIDNPEGRLRVDAQEVTLKGGAPSAPGQLGTIALAANAGNRQVDFQLQAPRFKFSAEGKVGIDAPYPANIQASLSGTDLSLIPTGVSGQPLKGNISAHVQAEGPIQTPKDGRADLAIEHLSAKTGKLVIENQGPIRIRYADERLIANSSTIVSGSSQLTFAGDLPPDPAGAPGRVEINGTFDLKELSAMAGEQAPVSATGEARLTGEIGGTLQNLSPRLSLTLTKATMTAQALQSPLQDVDLAAQLQNGRLDIRTLHASLAGGSIDGSGEIPLGIVPRKLPLGLEQAQGPARFNATVRGFQLESLSATPSDVSGTASLTIEASAPRADLDAVTGAARFNELRLRVGGFALEQQGTSQLGVRNGRISVDHFLLTGPETRVEASGSAALAAPGNVDLQLDGNLDTALLAFFASGVNASGPARFQLALSGSRVAPQARGFFELTNGQVVVEEPTLQFTDLDVRLDLGGNRITVSRLSGDLNGGSLSGSGQVIYSPEQFANINLDLSANNVFLEVPEGLQTVSRADLQVRSQRDLIVVGGQVTVLQGSFTKDVNLGEELLGIVGSSNQPVLSQERSALLSRVRFNLNVDSREPIIVDDNLAKLQMDLNVRLTGTYYQPGLTGTIALAEGGELYLRERTYYLDQGMISFTDQRRIQPNLDITARTQVKDIGENIDVTLRITGTPDNIQTSLTSDPSRPEPDLISLLITGRRLEEARGQASTVLREQTLSLLAGSVAGRLSTELQQATGLTTVRIEPNLIAAESDPTARLTLGEDITPQLELIYSMNLADSSDQIWIAEYDVTRNFTSRVIRETNPKQDQQMGGLYRFEFRHDLRLGGGPNTGEATRQGTREKRKVTAVNFTGSFPMKESVLADRLDVKPGDNYSFFEVRHGIEQLNKFLHEQGYLQSRVRLSRGQPAPGRVGLTIEVEAGPKVDFQFEGLSVPGAVKDKVRQAWIKGVFDQQRASDATDVVSTWLFDQGYLGAKIDWHADMPSSDTRLVTFNIEPGTRYENMTLEFPGASAIRPEELREQLDKAGLADKVQSEPGKVKDLLQSYYVRQGFLRAEVSSPRNELHPDTRSATVQVPIDEGTRSHLAEINFRGNKLFTDQELLAGIPLRVGQPYDPHLRNQSMSRIRNAYSRRGYNDVVIDYNVTAARETGRLNITFSIQENRKEVVRKIEVKGTERTDEHFVRELLKISTGEALDPQKLSDARRRMYDTGAYTQTQIETVELDKSLAQGPQEKPVGLEVTVREVKPYRLQYGGFYDTERGPGGIADITNRNSLANASVLGLRTRYDSDLREVRLYYSQPRVFGLPFDTNLVSFVNRELHQTAGFTVDRFGFSAEQQAKFRNQFIVSYGYRFEHDHTYEAGPNPFFDVTLNVAPLTATASRDLRDDVLDATRGSFTSHNLEYAPNFLGSDLRFIRYFGQYFQYIPLGPKREIPWAGGEPRARLVYAGGLRLGLARGFGGQNLVPSERFFAGGGTTIRGFVQDSIGPRNIIGDPAGGQAVFILNNELRFPLISIFDGVGFIDAGNVYRTVSDFNPFDLRSSAGFGLRVRTPYFLLRGDYGIKLDRKAGESFGEFYFSIGQAF